MDFQIDQWHDVLRLFVAFMCTVCLLMLIRRFYLQRDCWTVKTRDYWFSLMMWTCAGLAISVEGVVANLDFGVRLVFITAAALVSVKGLLRKEHWGGDD